MRRHIYPLLLVIALLNLLSASLVLVGLALGALFLDRADGLVPHAHYLLTGERRTDAANPGEDLPVEETRVASVVLFILAVGVQNVPEGFAVSIAAVNAGLDRRLYAAVAVVVAAPILPYAMGFAAGAMLFVISDEIVPETHLRGHERVATLGRILGTVVMLYLDTALA